MSENMSKQVSPKEAQAMERCAENISLGELSRITGIRIELLRRYINRQVGNIRAETWDRLYPHILPYLIDQQDSEKTSRIGPPYRRHAELVAMISDQKVLIDVIGVLPPNKREEALTILTGGAKVPPSEYTCLSPEENRIMGAYLALPEDQRDQRLRKLIAMGVEEIKKKRRGLAG